MRREDNRYISKRTAEKEYIKHKKNAEKFYKAIKNGKKALVVNHHDMH